LFWYRPLVRCQRKSDAETRRSLSLDNGALDPGNGTDTAVTKPSPPPRLVGGIEREAAREWSGRDSCAATTWSTAPGPRTTIPVYRPENRSNRCRRRCTRRRRIHGVVV